MADPIAGLANRQTILRQKRQKRKWGIYNSGYRGRIVAHEFPEMCLLLLCSVLISRRCLAPTVTCMLIHSSICGGKESGPRRARSHWK